MKLVSDLLCKNMIVLFIILILIEVIILIVIFWFYSYQIMKEIKPIRNQSFEHLEEILNSFNQIILRRLIYATTDLFIIQKHSMWLTSSNDQVLEKTSSYYNSFNNYRHLISYQNNSYSIDYLPKLKEQLIGKKDEEKLAQLLDESFLKTMVFNEIDFANTDDSIKIFHNHLIEIMKTIIIKDILIGISNKQFLLLNENVIAAYPPTPLSISDIIKLDYYLYEKTICRNKYEKSCLIDLFPDNTQNKNKIKILPPLLKKEGLSTLMCININTSFKTGTPPLNGPSALCSNFILETEIGKNINDDVNKILIVSYNEKLDDIQVHFTTNVEITSNSSFLQTSNLNKYKYLNNDVYLLFHIIYYSMSQNIIITPEFLSVLEEEYKEGTKELKEYLKTNKSPDIRQRFISQFTFFNRQYDTFGNLTYQNGFDQIDTFLMTVSPIVANLTEYDIDGINYIENNDILFYSMVICNNKESAFYNEHTLLFLFKLLKIGAFGICLNLFVNYFFYNIMSDYLNCILKPILIYQEKLKDDFSQSLSSFACNKILSQSEEDDDNSLDHNQETDRNRDKDKNNSKKNKKKSKPNSNNKKGQKKGDKDINNHPVYKNIETRQLEDSIIYIRNIYSSKGRSSIENLQNKIAIFDHLSNVILDKDSSLIKFDCLFLISYVQYKLNLYDDSLYTLTQLLALINKIKHNESSSEAVLNYFIKINQK